MYSEFLIYALSPYECLIESIFNFIQILLCILWSSYVSFIFLFAHCEFDKAQPEHQSLKRDPWFWDFHFYDTALPEHQMFKRPEIPESQMFQMPRYGRSNENTMIPVARIGKRSDDQSEDNYYKSIPMPRIG